MKEIIWNLIGAPGCGKGATSDHLMANVPNIAKLGTGDRCRAEIEKNTEAGQTIASYNHSGFLVPDEIIIPITCECLAAMKEVPHSVIMTDAVTRTLMQYKVLAKIAADWGYQLRTIYLADPIEDCYARLCAAARNRSDDKPEVIDNRMREYREKTLPTIDFARRFEKEQFVEIVTNSLEEKLGRVLQVVLG